MSIFSTFAHADTRQTATSERSLDRRVAMQAAEWFILFESSEASAAEVEKFERWRNSDVEHERAWRRAQHVSHRAGMVPAQIGSPILRRPVQRRDAIKALAILMVAAPTGWLAYNELSRRNSANHYATNTGEQRAITLADGTKIQLNTSTEIDVAYDQSRRLVILHGGEILIETALDPLAFATVMSRPFMVNTKQGDIRAIGTRFVVRQDDGRSRVSVLQGAVELKPVHNAGLIQRVDAGEQSGLMVDGVDQKTELDANASLWVRGVLAVDDMRLDTFAAELSRYRSGVIRCDPAVAGLRITGAFQLADTDAALENVAQLLPVQIHFRTRYWATIVPAENKSKNL
ncbi:FecR domain-containing protein [Herminiimonas aquatilis]|uniref:FecR domain-containing protein n=1 Tax=Herminiimonas aquatilis TaxID=345342 RepID=A0ABW2J478_9BURK